MSESFSAGMIFGAFIITALIAMYQIGYNKGFSVAVKLSESKIDVWRLLKTAEKEGARTMSVLHRG